MDNNQSIQFYSNHSTAYISAHQSRSIIYNFKLINCVDAYTTSISDNRLKHNETAILNGLDIINKLNPQKYYQTTEIYSSDHIVDFQASDVPEGTWLSGFIAQDVANIPELKHIVDIPTKIDDIYSMNYNSVHAYSIKAIQELHLLVTELREEINELKKID